MHTARSLTIALPAVVDLDALDEVRDRLGEAIEQGPVEVSCAGVEQVSTNALFMLISAGETARRNGSAFMLREISGAMQAAIERLGLGDSFAGLAGG